MLCCQSGLILTIVTTLQKAHSRLDGKSAIEMLLLLKSLGMHSITPLELKNVIALLKDPFPFKSHVIHVLSSMSKGDGFVVCRQYFDISAKDEGLTVPTIRQWPGPIAGGHLQTLTILYRVNHKFGNGRFLLIVTICESPDGRR